MWLYNNLGIGVHVFVCERTSERKCVCLCWLAHTEYAIIINRRKRHHRNNHRKHIQQPEAWPQRSAHSTTHRIHEKLLCTVCRVRTDQMCVCPHIYFEWTASTWAMNHWYIQYISFARSRQLGLFFVSIVSIFAMCYLLCCVYTEKWQWSRTCTSRHHYTP